MGSNEVGLCVINTASYNLKYEKYKGEMEQEGIIIRKALSTCKTVKDVDALFESTKGTRGVEANFGVIDADGGAAYYETTPFGYTKFDVTILWLPRMDI